MCPAFLSDWFTKNIPVWEKHLSHLKGGNVHALEIGCFEGRATCFLLEHILTSRASTITCIDPFPIITREQLEKYAERWQLSTLPSAPIDIEKRFDRNIAEICATEKVIKHKGLSKYILRALQVRGYDLIYIDGSHFKEDVLKDIILSWDLLKDGGIMIFDDYRLRDAAPELGDPKAAIDAFLDVFDGHYDVLHKEWQVILKKTPLRQGYAGQGSMKDYPPIGRQDEGVGRREKIVSITYAKNEEDILESFVRHHSTIFDRMIIVLHTCTDRSRDILEELKHEGLPIEIRFDDSAYHAQSEVLTGLLHTIDDAQWICPLDCDEFLIATEGDVRDVLLGSSTQKPLSVPWITYVPTPHDDLAERHPIQRIRHRRATEPRPFSKVVIPSDIARRVTLPRGNHYLMLEGKPMEVPTHETLRIAHFPVRSEQQLRKKILGHWESVQKNPDFEEGTSFQWAQLVERCKDPAEITKEELCQIALRYALKPEDPETSYILDGTIEAHGT